MQKTIEIFQVIFWETPDLSNHKDLSCGWLGMAGSFCLPKKPASDGFTGWEMSWKSKRGGVWNGSMPWRWRSVRQGIGWINTCTLVHQLGALEAIWVTQNPGFQSITIENQCFLVSEEALQCLWRAWVMQPCCHVVMLGNWNIGCHAGGTGRGGTRKSSERLSKGLVETAWGSPAVFSEPFTLNAPGGAPSRASRSWKCLASKNGTHLKVWFLFFHIWRKQLHIQILLPISNSATQTHQQSTNSQQKILQSQTPLVLSWIHHLLRPFTASALVPFRPQLPCLPASPRAGNDPKTWASWGSWPGSTTGSACQVRTGKLKIKHFHEKKMLKPQIYVKGGLLSILNDFSCILCIRLCVYYTNSKHLCHAWYQGDVLISSVHGVLVILSPFAAKGRSFTGSVSMNSSIFGKQSSSTWPPENMNEMVIY